MPPVTRVGNVNTIVTAKIAADLAQRAKTKLLHNALMYAAAAVQRSDRTGPHYHDSFHCEVQPTQRGGQKVVLWNTVAHARFIEGGTKEHWIEARNAPMLVFMYKGHLIRKKKVHHPGTKAQNVMAMALSDLLSEPWLRRRA